jgi:hypothetical protein
VDFAGAVIAGSLPRRALALVAEWTRLHEDELAANWEHARRDEPLEPIDAGAALARATVCCRPEKWAKLLGAQTGR